MQTKKKYTLCNTLVKKNMHLYKHFFLHCGLNRGTFTAATRTLPSLSCFCTYTISPLFLLFITVKPRFDTVLLTLSGEPARTPRAIGLLFFLRLCSSFNTTMSFPLIDLSSCLGWYLLFFCKPRSILEMRAHGPGPVKFL